MRIILVRHGESVANTKDYIGDPYDSPLTDLGVQQALKAGEFIAQNYNVKMIYYSSLPRAVESAKLMNQSIKAKMSEHKYIYERTEGPDITGITVDELSNITNGKTLKRIIDDEEKISIIEKTKNVPSYVYLKNKWCKLTNSEDEETLRKRCVRVFENMACKHATEDILLVTHGIFIKSFISAIFDISVDGMGDNFGTYKNCSITSILSDYDSERLELMLYSKYLD